ncbi:hypothetical protein [Candidatus Synechococcus spongiarum]|uniref:Uncharacterized protein n=1 Tax=Candidatus Synechococcus spongiarum TaxID=431041 RepID=A0A170T5W8_9SYNE|nr:hypothetical protein [Candidatus Synechococcus spongiarum]CZB14061.1 hypothetical protein FLM9_435 [Candidatus Synechococcus spongiarum]
MDPTSLERLAALKRQLPQKLPLPDQRADQAADHKSAQRQPARRHPLETIQDPEHLFGELMNTSPDGHVPDHLLERLRSLEQQRAEDAGGQAQPANGDVNREQEQYSLFEALLGDED